MYLHTKYFRMPRSTCCTVAKPSNTSSIALMSRCPGKTSPESTQRPSQMHKYLLMDSPIKEHKTCTWAKGPKKYLLFSFKNCKKNMQEEKIITTAIGNGDFIILFPLVSRILLVEDVEGCDGYEHHLGVPLEENIKQIPLVPFGGLHKYHFL